MRWFCLAAILSLLAPAVSAQPLPDGGVTGEEIAKIMTAKGPLTASAVLLLAKRKRG